jgi:26S proteasome regulatory subunit N9
LETSEAKDAFVLAKMEAAHYRLITGDADGCKKAIDECAKILETLPSVEPIINASFYRVSADYYKVREREGRNAYQTLGHL